MKGSIEVITGPMFAGKSTELQRRIRRHDIAGNRIRLCKPKRDTRSEAVHTHDGDDLPAIGIRDLFDGIFSRDDYDVIAVDEVQFLEMNPLGDAELIFDLAKRGTRMIFAGLDTDHFGNSFITTAMLMGMASSVTKLTSVCSQCNEFNACRTQWISDMPYNEHTRVGGADKYAPRCLACFEPLDLDGADRLTLEMARGMDGDTLADVIPLRK